MHRLLLLPLVLLSECTDYDFGDFARTLAGSDTGNCGDAGSEL